MTCLSPIKAKYKETHSGEWYDDVLVWNTREIKNFFSQLEPNYDMGSYLKAMGWSYDEYWFNVQWTETGFIFSNLTYLFKFPRIPATEDLVRGYYKDEEEPVLWSVCKSTLLDSNSIFQS